MVCNYFKHGFATRLADWWFSLADVHLVLSEPNWIET